MNIKKYSSYFHDGGLINVEQKQNHLEILMHSAELWPQWNEDNIPLSNFLTIKGKLHLEGVRSLIINHNLSDAIQSLLDRLNKEWGVIIQGYLFLEDI